MINASEGDDADCQKFGDGGNILEVRGQLYTVHIDGC